MTVTVPPLTRVARRAAPAANPVLHETITKLTVPAELVAYPERCSVAERAL
jgi:hypothetical protein